jgi:DNA repair protein RecO (recombination protein O)
MPLIETESLVLKTYNLAEADRIVVFFTRDHGIVRGVARGAKRLKSRFGSTLEPFSTIDLSYFQKEDRELVSIQSADLLRSYFEQAGEPLFLDTFSYIVDLLLQFTPPNDPNETLFRMLKACLAAASDNEVGLFAIQTYFELWLLRLGGFLPDWGRCEDCKRPFETDDEATLRGGFHLHCKRCRSSSGVLQVTPEHRELYRDIQRVSPAQFIEFAKGRESAVSDLSTVMRRLISQILESPPTQNQKTTELARKNAI